MISKVLLVSFRCSLSLFSMVDAVLQQPKGSYIDHGSFELVRKEATFCFLVVISVACNDDVWWWWWSRRSRWSAPKYLLTLWYDVLQDLASFSFMLGKGDGGVSSVVGDVEMGSDTRNRFKSLHGDPKSSSSLLSSSRSRFWLWWTGDTGSVVAIAQCRVEHPLSFNRLLSSRMVVLLVGTTSKKKRETRGCSSYSKLAKPTFRRYDTVRWSENRTGTPTTCFLCSQLDWKSEGLQLLSWIWNIHPSMEAARYFVNYQKHLVQLGRCLIIAKIEINGFGVSLGWCPRGHRCRDGRQEGVCVFTLR